QRAGGDVPQGQAVAGADVREATGQHLVTLVQTVRYQDVALFTVFVVEQGDARGAIRIVLDVGYNGGNADLVAPEVDGPIAPLVATAAKTRRDAAIVVATTRARLALEQLLERSGRRDLLEVAAGVLPAPGGGRFENTDTHRSTPQTSIPRLLPRTHRRTECRRPRPG